MQLFIHGRIEEVLTNTQFRIFNIDSPIFGDSQPFHSFAKLLCVVIVEKGYQFATLCPRSEALSLAEESRKLGSLVISSLAPVRLSQTIASERQNLWKLRGIHVPRKGRGRL